MPSSSSRTPVGQGHSRQPAVANDVVPAAITFAALGLDISQAEVMVCLLLPDGRELVPRWTIPNSLPGAQALAERVQVLVKEQGIQELRIGQSCTILPQGNSAKVLDDLAPVVGRHVGSLVGDGYRPLPYYYPQTAD